MPLTQKHRSAVARESRSNQLPHDESAQRTCQHVLQYVSTYVPYYEHGKVLY